MKIIATASALMLAAVPAMAQTDFATPQPGRVAQGFVPLCSNGATPPQYVPCNATGSSGSAVATTPTAPGYAAEVGSPNAAAGIVPVVTAAGTSLIVKASQGNLYSGYATNGTTTAGFLVAINAATVPASGATITPLECVAMPGNTTGGAGMATLFFGAGPPDAFSTGIVLLLSTSCTTYTPGTLSAFISARPR